MPCSHPSDGISPADRLGVCQWFHFLDFRLVEATLATLLDVGVRHLRTGLSWADWHRPGGTEWYDWQMEQLLSSGLEVLLSVWHTPPSISMEPGLGRTSVPPARTRDCADFVDLVITRYGDCFDTLELWNEPNNPYKWSSRHDPHLERFAALVIDAGNWARVRGKRTVLGGMVLLDLAFVDRMRERGVLQSVDVLGIHAFPEMWEPFATSWDCVSHWHGWGHRTRTISERAGGTPVWVTETGLRPCARAPSGAARPCRWRFSWTRCALPSSASIRTRSSTCHRIGLPSRRSTARLASWRKYHMGLVCSAPGFSVAGHERPAFHVLRRVLAEAPSREPVAQRSNSGQSGSNSRSP